MVQLKEPLPPPKVVAVRLGCRRSDLNERYDQLDLVEIDGELARRAGELAEAHALRGYDAVHLAAAVRLRDPELVVVAGDEGLLAAARDEGMATAPLVWAESDYCREDRTGSWRGAPVGPSSDVS